MAMRHRAASPFPCLRPPSVLEKRARDRGNPHVRVAKEFASLAVHRKVENIRRSKEGERTVSEERLSGLSLRNTKGQDELASMIQSYENNRKIRLRVYDTHKHCKKKELYDQENIREQYLSLDNKMNKIFKEKIRNSQLLFRCQVNQLKDLINKKSLLFR